MQQSKMSSELLKIQTRIIINLPLTQINLRSY